METTWILGIIGVSRRYFTFFLFLFLFLAGPVLSDEQMSNGWAFSQLNDKQRVATREGLFAPASWWFWSLNFGKLCVNFWCLHHNEHEKRMEQILWYIASKLLEPQIIWGVIESSKHKISSWWIVMIFANIIWMTDDRALPYTSFNANDEKELMTLASISPRFCHASITYMKIWDRDRTFSQSLTSCNIYVRTNMTTGTMIFFHGSVVEFINNSWTRCLWMSIPSSS